ncbi:unnamed protein product [Choristocarpus tenellus]
MKPRPPPTQQLDAKESKKKESYNMGAQRMRKINERNRVHNVTTDTVKGREKRQEDSRRRQEKANGGSVEEFDPFQRRACRPKILWSVQSNKAPASSGVPGDSPEGEGGGDEAGESKSEASEELAKDGSGAREVADASMQAPHAVLQKAHSFEGRDVLEAGRAAAMSLKAKGQRMAAPASSEPRRSGLSIANYLSKARKSLGADPEL